MELSPLPGQLDVAQLQAAGEARRMWHGPRSLEEILSAAAAEMDADDLRAAWADSYVQYLNGGPVQIRHPRRKLRALLRGR